MNHRQLALDQLKALMEIPGALQTITSEVKPEYRQDKTDPRSPLSPSMEHHRTNPAVYVCVPVVILEGPDAAGAYRAVAEDGSWRAGYPEDLLPALIEWQHARPVE